MKRQIEIVIPAKAGIQSSTGVPRTGSGLGSRFRGNDGHWIAAAICAAMLSGCSNYTVPSPFAAGASGSGSTGATKSCNELFTQRVQPRLELCRSCHIPGGVADVTDGRLFMLSTHHDEDFLNLQDSYERLGGAAAGVSRILKMASGTDTRSHTGGVPWPVGSSAYLDMAAQLAGFTDPQACLLGGTGGVPAEQPLLGSKHALSLWAGYCENQPDSTALPADPRSRVVPGFNAGKAVYYNAWYQDCHVNLPAEQHPKTCGEFRARRDSGRDFLMNVLPASPVAAASYNDTWKKWGLAARPANFDELYTLRYGLNHAPFPNPYPTPTDTPAQIAAGGTGQLPLGLRQMKDANGNWNGQIGSAACFQCHGGQIGEPSAIGLDNLGLGNNNYDVLMSSQDASPWAGTQLAPLLPAVDVNALFNIGIKQRGQNNAVGAFEFLITVLDLDSLGVNPNPLKTVVETTGPQDLAHPLAHTQDTPAWWNMGSRPRKFFDAGVSTDSTRIIMAAGPGEVSTLFSTSGKPYRDRIEQYDQDLEAFFLSLKSPLYPGPVDTALAATGAVLFHTKDLFAIPANASRPKPPGGNGSCAGCHGAYSPRYVHDTAYLPDPAMEGVAGHISTLDVIGTDRARSDMLTPTLRQRWDSTYWGYTDGTPGFVAPEGKDPVTEALDDMFPVAMRPVGVCGWEKEVIGYQAPPLYGVWATAPYFHNGSVPTVEAVLDSSKRAAIWQRKLQTEGPVTGFDQDLARAYDFSALGWKHDELGCAVIPGNMLYNCNPANAAGPSIVELAQNFLNSSLSWAGLISIPDPAPGGADKRLVYDTRILGNGNGGHTFTDALTPQERKAIIEYLKTL